MEKQTITPIAIIKTDYKEKFGIPRQSGRVPAIGKIIFNKEYRNKLAIKGIEQFSHLWLIFDFHKSHTEIFNATVRPPRLGGNERLGVFATRSPFRPNSLGLSVVKLVKVNKTKENGNELIVSGVDLLDGTPIYDIKPYIPYADNIKNAKGGFAEENKNHKIKVNFKKELLELIPKNLQKVLIKSLSDDPRPSYQKGERTYSMKFNDFDVSFKISNDVLTVTKVVKI